MREEDKRILEALTEKYGKEQLLEFLNSGGLKRALAIGAISGALLGAGNHLYRDYKNPENKEKIEMQAEKHLPANFDEKVDAVRSYMKYALENQKYKYENLRLSPESLVLASIENDFDLPMMMAQAHQESCFGMTPRARRTNSVFSVGSYDDGTDLYTYKTQDDSIQPYIDLLKKSYMVNGKTELDLLKPRAFVNFRGNRYAGDPNYEAHVRNIRNRIIAMYPVLAD